jgi:hypothetical protein
MVGGWVAATMKRRGTMWMRVAGLCPIIRIFFQNFAPNEK